MFLTRQKERGAAVRRRLVVAVACLVALTLAAQPNFAAQGQSTPKEQSVQTLGAFASPWPVFREHRQRDRQDEKQVDSQDEGQAGGQDEDQSRGRDADSDGEQDDKPPTLEIRWDQGLRVEALRGNFTLRVAGSAQNDSAFLSDNGTEAPGGTIQNGVEWRRARLVAEGDLVQHVSYQLQYDFAVNSPPNLKDAYIQFNAPVVPVILRGGRFRAPIGLEGFTGGNDTTFLERGLINTFVPSRNSGGLFITDAARQAHNFRAAVGAVKPEDDVGIGSTDTLGLSSRFSYAFHPREGVLVHAGGDYMHRPVDETIRFLQRPESHLAPQFTDTGDITADSVDTGLFEFAVVRGPFSFQTEGAITSVNRGEHDQGSPFFWGGYAFVSWFITGETRLYQEDSGNFGRLRPASPFMGADGGGTGAFELALRVSYLDLDDKDINGGRMTDGTGGFNWYATRNARVMTNVIWSNATLLDDPVWIGQVRLQWAY